MALPLAVLSIPGLRRSDLPLLPALSRRCAPGRTVRLMHSFPAVTWPAQATLLTGRLPNVHGVVANGFFWRDRGEVEMWTAPNDVIQAPQIWDRLKQSDPSITTAVWFPMLAKACKADVICMPAPVHNPDGSESPWCYSRPQELYGELVQRFGHFPLHHFWGPLASIASSRWIAESAVAAAETRRPDFWYIYIPHLDYAAQKFGPDSREAAASLADLDGVLLNLVTGMETAYGGPVRWVVVTEYVIQPVEHVVYPNRMLREAGLLAVEARDGAEWLDTSRSAAWALADHQFSHVFVRDGNAGTIDQVIRLFDDCDGVQMVLAGQDRDYLNMNHPRAGDVVVVSAPGSWQAYYWWLDDARAPPFARTVDIHRKPGYDPVELFVDPATRSIPLDAGRVRGSHGAPRPDEQQGVLLTSWAADLKPRELFDWQVHDWLLHEVLAS